MPTRHPRRTTHPTNGRLLTAAILLAASSQATAVQPPRISGEQKQWHAVTLNLDGPTTSETAAPNPFTDYRLTVTFTHESGTPALSVPGYFAADGNAAETSAVSGSTWRAHLTPSRPGAWSYRVSMLAGPDVAVNDAPGQPVPDLDSLHGTFQVDPTDKSAPDFRVRGTLEYVGERYLRFAGDGGFFLKGGVDSPETMLGYADFDGTFRDTRATLRPPAPHSPIRLPALDDGEGLHRFAPHVRDWREGDPSWQDGKGKGLIGGLNYLASQGVNSAYFLTMNVNGDGRSAWPWADPQQRDRFDCSKLDQWNIVFNHMTRLGLMLHVVTQETENDHLLDGGDLGRERKLYYRELVGRFGHHPAITWNLGEENVQSPEQQRACAAEIRRLDPYRHHIVLHNDHWHAKNLAETFDPLLGPGDVKGRPTLTGAAIQDFYWPDIYPHVLAYVQASAEAGFPWVVTADELGGAQFGTRTDADDPAHDAPRRFGLWASLMAGGAGVEWYFGWQNNSPHSDLSAEDWRTREDMYRQTRIALDFFHEHLPFPRMTPAPDRVVGHGAMALADDDNLLAVYLPHGAGTRIQLGDRPGLFEIRWFNPRDGGALLEGNIPRVRGPGLSWTGEPPADPHRDWLALARRIPETAPAMTFPGEAWAVASPLDLGVDPAGLNHALNRWKMDTGTNGVDEVVVVRRGVVIHQGPNTTRVHNLWSATKSFTSTALGLLIADGVVSLDTRATDIDPDLQARYPNARLRHFTTMTSGYNADGRSRWSADSEDWSRNPYHPAPPLFEPGAAFAYWDEAQMMFGRLMTMASEQDLFTLLGKRVFEPIGLRGATWHPEGDWQSIPIRNGCTGLAMNALDLARFGHLFLNQGRWGGRQVVPANWVREATRPQVSVSTPVADTDRKATDGAGVYGFNWWCNGTRPDGTRWMPDTPPLAYFAAGLNHNICLVIPEWDMIVARTGTDHNPPYGHAETLNRFLRRLGPAVYPLEPKP